MERSASNNRHDYEEEKTFKSCYSPLYGDSASLTLAEPGTLIFSPSSQPAAISSTTDIQPSNCNQDHAESDSDASIEIIDVPKKPVPFILISDSEDEDGDKAYENEASQQSFGGSHIKNINHVKNEDDKMNDSVKDRLMEYKENIFPVKREGREDNSSPSNKHELTCTICLGSYDDRAFLDSCFHSFCYMCILQWSNVVHTCPLCKSSFKSIIHDIKPDFQYKQHFMKKPKSSNDQQSLGSLNYAMDSGRRFHYRTTSIPGNRRTNADFERQRRYDAWRRQRLGNNNLRGVQRSRWGHSAATHDRRKMIYRLGMVVKEVKHYGRVRYRDISVDFLRNNPAVIHKFVPWILRDLNVLLENNTEHVSFVLHLILSIFPRISIESQEFHDQLQPFLSDNTSQFIRELKSFASSPYDMRGYDEKVVYDMPSSQNIDATSNRTINTFANVESLVSERKIPFEDRLMDEALADSRKNSPPLTNGFESSSEESFIVNVDGNSDDSDLEITKVIHMQSRSCNKLQRNDHYCANQKNQSSCKQTGKTISPTKQFERDLQTEKSTVISHNKHIRDSNCEIFNRLHAHSTESDHEILSPSYPMVQSSESSSFFHSQKRNLSPTTSCQQSSASFSFRSGREEEKRSQASSRRQVDTELNYFDISVPPKTTSSSSAQRAREKKRGTESREVSRSSSYTHSSKHKSKKSRRRSSSPNSKRRRDYFNRERSLSSSSTSKTRHNDFNRERRRSSSSNRRFKRRQKIHEPSSSSRSTSWSEEKLDFYGDESSLSSNRSHKRKKKHKERSEISYSESDDLISSHKSSKMSTNKHFENSSDSYIEINKKYREINMNGRNECENLHCRTLKSVIVKCSESGKDVFSKKKFKQKESHKHKKSRHKEKCITENRNHQFKSFSTRVSETRESDNSRSSVTQTVKNESQRNSDILAMANENSATQRRTTDAIFSPEITHCDNADKTNFVNTVCGDKTESKVKKQLSEKHHTKLSRQSITEDSLSDALTTNNDLASATPVYSFDKNSSHFDDHIITNNSVEGTEFNHSRRLLNVDCCIPDLLLDVKSIDDSHNSPGNSKMQSATCEISKSFGEMNFQLHRDVNESGEDQKYALPSTLNNDINNEDLKEQRVGLVSQQSPEMVKVCCDIIGAGCRREKNGEENEAMRNNAVEENDCLGENIILTSESIATNRILDNSQEIKPKTRKMKIISSLKT